MDLDKILHEKFVTPSIIKYITASGFTLTEDYENLKEEIDNFEIHDENVWVCSFPKTGTTWTQEMVWMIVNDVDFEKSKELLDARAPYFEYSTVMGFAYTDTELPAYVLDSIGYTKNMQKPTVIKTHLPFQLFPKEIRNGSKKPKIVYVTREPKDTCVSFYHHAKLLQGFIGTFEEFCELFLGGKLLYAPYWQHVLPFWNMRNSPNILFLKYEDMKRDLPGVIRKIARFLERSLTEEQVDLLSKHLSFDKMKNNPAVNKEDAVAYLGNRDGKFIRSGTVGGHKRDMSEECIKRFDDWIEDNIKETDYVV